MVGVALTPFKNIREPERSHIVLQNNVPPGFVLQLTVDRKPNRKLNRVASAATADACG